MKPFREQAGIPSGWKRFIVILTAVIGSFVLAAPAAKAGLIDRLQDIYRAPDKLEDIQTEYNKTKEELDRQAEQFALEREEMQKRTEALSAQNETLASHNESLASQNAALLDRLDKAEREKEKKAERMRKILLTAGALLSMGLAYFLSIRFWRFLAWRRHHRVTGGHSQ